jgi:hypothetical protein
VVVINVALIVIVQFVLMFVLGFGFQIVMSNFTVNHGYEIVYGSDLPNNSSLEKQFEDAVQKLEVRDCFIPCTPNLLAYPQYTWYETEMGCQLGCQCFFVVHIIFLLL